MRIRSVVVVGCGGLLYHGLGRLAVLLNAHGVAECVLVDGDLVEPGNMERQWGAGAGTPKVGVARGHLQMLVRDTLLVEHDLYVRGPDVRTLVGSGAGEAVVCTLPDNHRARVDVHRGIEGCEVPVVEVVAGNDTEAGFAYAGEWDPAGGWLRDWTTRHPDVLAAAEREREGVEVPGVVSCSAQPEQSAEGNMLTALLWTNLLERILREEYYSAVDGECLREAYWGRNEDGSVNVWYE